MSVPSELQATTLTDAAIWALERLSQPRYGRDAPALGWSVTQELIRAGFVNTSANGRGAVSVTESGRNFLLRRAQR